MAKFYAVGKRQVKEKVDGETVVSNKNMLITLDSTTRVLAVKEAEEIAKRNKVKLDGVYTPKNYEQTSALTMTKEFKKRKKERAGKRKV